MTVWIVGTYRAATAQGRVWDLAGVFSSRALALGCCHSENDFIAPLEMDARGPDETVDFPSIEYPKAAAA